MKPAVCEKHGIQGFTLTSSDFALAIKEKRRVNVGEICLINTNSLGKKVQTFVDKKFFNRFFKDLDTFEVLLLDREKNPEEMNDRLLVRKVFSDSDLKYVCPVCLFETINHKN